MVCNDTLAERARVCDDMTPAATAWTAKWGERSRSTVRDWNGGVSQSVRSTSHDRTIQLHPCRSSRAEHFGSQQASDKRGSQVVEGTQSTGQIDCQSNTSPATADRTNRTIRRSKDDELVHSLLVNLNPVDCKAEETQAVTHVSKGNGETSLLRCNQGAAVLRLYSSTSRAYFWKASSYLDW